MLVQKIIRKFIDWVNLSYLLGQYKVACTRCCGRCAEAEFMNEQFR
jgi:hypothetical protein